MLIRQNLKNATEDHKKILLGFQYGGVPSINSLQSIYNFQDKPWVYAHLRDIQLRLGVERFPLIAQEYYPDHREMVSAGGAPACGYPCVFKVGHAHGGLGKVKVESETAYQVLTDHEELHLTQSSGRGQRGGRLRAVRHGGALHRGQA